MDFPKAQPARWLIYLFGCILAVSPILRFSWDYQTQTVLGLAIILSFLYLLNNYKFNPDFKKDYLYILFFAIVLAPCYKVKEISVFRDELFYLFSCMIFSYIFAHLSLEDKKKLLKIPVYVGIWFSIIIITYFVMNPKRYILGTILPSEIIVNINILAGYLTLCLSLSLIYWKNENSNYRMLTVLIFLAILLSKSRIAIFGSIVIVCFYVYYFYRPFFRFTRLFIILMSAGLLLITFLKLEQYRLSENLYLSDRSIWWKTALAVFRENYIIGTGWGSFGNVYLNYRPLPVLNTLYVHNLPLELLVEAGILGFIVFILILKKPFNDRRQFLEGRDNDLYLPVFAGLCSFLFINLLDYSIYVHSLLMLFWIFLGILFFKDRHLEKREKNLLPLSLYGLANILVLLILVKPFAGYIFYRSGVSLYNEQNLERAEGKLNLAIALDPQASVYYNELAKVSYYQYTQTKNKVYLQNAILSEKDAISHFENNAVYWSDLSWLYWSDGKPEFALKAILKAVKYDRFNPNYHGSLKYFLKNKYHV